MPVTRLFLSALACSMIAATVAARSADAQANVEFIPFFGTYFSIADVIETQSAGETVAGEQLTAPTVGVRIRALLRGRFAVEGSLAYSTSDVTFPVAAEDPGGTPIPALQQHESSVLLASGRLVFQPPRSNLRLFGGVGVVNRAGDAWTGLDGLMSIAGTLGLGVRAAITPRFALDVAVEASLYSFDPNPTQTGAADLFESKFQQDVLVTVGIPIGVLNR